MNPFAVIDDKGNVYEKLLDEQGRIFDPEGDGGHASSKAQDKRAELAWRQKNNMPIKTLSLNQANKPIYTLSLIHI